MRGFSEIVGATGLTQSNVSNHLGCLRDCGLVIAKQKGRFVHYELSDERWLMMIGKYKLSCQLRLSMQGKSKYVQVSLSRTFQGVKLNSIPFQSFFFRSLLIHRHPPLINHHAIFLLGAFQRDISLLHILQHATRISLEWKIKFATTWQA